MGRKKYSKELKARIAFDTIGIFNTDQGTQYSGNAFTGALKDHGVQISMDGIGRCMGDIFIERL